MSHGKYQETDSGCIKDGYNANNFVFYYFRKSIADLVLKLGKHFEFVLELVEKYKSEDVKLYGDTKQYRSGSIDIYVEQVNYYYCISFSLTRVAISNYLKNIVEKYPINRRDIELDFLIFMLPLVIKELYNLTTLINIDSRKIYFETYVTLRSVNIA